MTSLERWTEIQALFEELLDLPEESRQESLRERCGTDEDLFDAVHGLLESDAAVDPRFLQPGDPETITGPSTAGHGFLETRRIGEFQLERTLGSGGMGTVYLARQENPQRRVAVKVLQPAHSLGSLARRFRLEADLLARLKHPNVAQVFAAGVHVVSAGGVTIELPWYAMELLEEALPITLFAERRGLGLAARIELILPVLDAVQYAHQRGIIHRDLKPPNILVDPAGVARLIDFGIARDLGEGGEMLTRQTMSGELLGTLRYMPPEQLLGDADQTDTRFDVYALGVVLYELLCGEPPYDLERLPLHRAVEHVRRTPPRRPTALRPDLPRELEWLLLRATEAQPRRRYPTVQELADDLRRFQCHSPLLAAPPSRVYLAMTFARRHRIAMLAASAVLLSLLVGLGVSLLSLREAQISQRQATGEATRAAIEAETSRLTVGFFDNAFRQASIEQRGKDLTVIEMLEEASQFAHENLGDRPRVAARFLASLGALQKSLGEWTAAESLLREASERWFSVAIDPSQNDETEQGVKLLADLLICQMNAGLLNDASRTLTRARELSATIDEAPAAALRLRAIEGTLLYRLGRLAEAEPILREVLAARTEQLGADHRETSETENMLALTLLDLGRIDEAEPVTRDVLDRVMRTAGAKSPEAFLATKNLAELLNDQRKYDEARDLLEKILPSVLDELGPEHPITMQLCVTLSQSCWSAGDRDRAIDLSRTALNQARALLGYTHPQTLTSTNYVVSMLHRVKRDAEGEAIARDALDHLDSTQLPLDHVGIASVRLALAEILLTTERPTEAEAELLQVDASFRATYGRDHALTRRVAAMLVGIYEKTGNVGGASRDAAAPVE